MVWIGLVLPAGVAMLLPRLPHDHGLTSHGRPWAVASWTPQYREQLCWDEAACRACAHCVGGRHHRPRVGRDVQQVGRRHPWQGQVRLPHQIQVRTAEMIIRQRFSIKGNRVVFYRRKIKLEQPVQQPPPAQLKMNECFFEMIFSREE